MLHWSNIIGATHSKNYTLWEFGGYASLGLKELAEFGIIRTLEAEIKNHVNLTILRIIFFELSRFFIIFQYFEIINTKIMKNIQKNTYECSVLIINKKN